MASGRKRERRETHPVPVEGAGCGQSSPGAVPWPLPGSLPGAAGAKGIAASWHRGAEVIHLRENRKRLPVELPSRSVLIEQ